MVTAYWNIGRLIIEEERAGKNRAGYGTHLPEDLSLRLTDEFGRGFSATNLKNFRQFYLIFPKGHCVGDIQEDTISYTVCSELSWGNGAHIVHALSTKLQMEFGEKFGSPIRLNRIRFDGLIFSRGTERSAK